MNTSAPTTEQREEIKSTGKTFSWWSAGLQQMNHTKWDSAENEWVYWLSSDKPSMTTQANSEKVQIIRSAAYQLRDLAVTNHAISSQLHEIATAIYNTTLDQPMPVIKLRGFKDVHPQPKKKTNSDPLHEARRIMSTFI
jgi:hypothetical protein